MYNASVVFVFKNVNVNNIYNVYGNCINVILYNRYVSAK